MLTLRPEQLQVFSQLVKDQFVKQMLTQLRQHFPAPTADLEDEALKIIINQGIDTASQYNFKNENEVEGYLNLQFALGSEFDTTPWAQRILTHQRYSPNKKIELLSQQAGVKDLPKPTHRAQPVGSPIMTCPVTDCTMVWQSIDDQVEELLKIEDPIVRNQAFNAAYAQLYLEEPALQWSGVVAFASKQVGCGMRDAKALMNDGIPDLEMPDVVYRTLAEGNKLIFKETYPVLKFYHEHGMEKLRQCIKDRQPFVEEEFLRGFEAVAKGELETGARQMLKYEQIDILQDSVYLEKDFVNAVRLNQYLVKSVGEISPLGVKKIKVAFSAKCDGGREVVFEGWHLDDPNERWPYAQQVGNTFQQLVEEQPGFLEGQLQELIDYQKPTLLDEFGHPGLAPPEYLNRSYALTRECHCDSKKSFVLMLV